MFRPRALPRCEAELRRKSAHERIDQPKGEPNDDNRRHRAIGRPHWSGPANNDLWAGKLLLESHAQGPFFEGLEELRLSHASYLRRGRKGGYWEGLQVESTGKVLVPGTEGC